MNTEKTVRELEVFANEMARQYAANVTRMECRVSYARGIRAMAAIVEACARVADRMAQEQKNDPILSKMLGGYAQALRKIVESADDLIPPHYEV